MSEVRVILVGRTGLDAKLRLDALVELVRVRTAMDAIGELSESGADRHCVVVIGTEGLTRLNEDWAKDLTHGLRLAHPRVRVLVSTTDKQGPWSSFDGVVNAEVSAEALRVLIHGAGAQGRAEEPPARPPVAPARPEVIQETKPAPAAPDCCPVGAMGDEALVKAMLRGQDVAEAAVAVLRVRLNDPTVTFYAKDAEPDQLRSTHVQVTWDGQVLGALSASRADHAALSRAADWMAGWVRLHNQQANLRDAAFTDSLTGAWNRRYFDRFLASAMDAARGARRSVTVLLFDIDDFKRYNDRYGHDAGDEILKETVKLLRSVVRPTDRVCRVGGDEFAVVFHEPTGPREPNSRHPASIWSIAERFQKKVAEHSFPKLTADAPGRLTISGGLATFPWDGVTPEELVRRADQLALESKRLGKNVVTLGPGAAGEAAGGEQTDPD